MRVIGKPRPHNQITNVLLETIRGAMYECQIPLSAVNFLIMNSHLLPPAIICAVNNTACRIGGEQVRVGGPLAGKAEKDRLLEIMSDCFPHERLISETVQYLIDNPHKLPRLMQRLVVRAGSRGVNRNSLEWTRVFQKMSLAPEFTEDHFPLGEPDLAGVTQEEVTLEQTLPGTDLLRRLECSGHKPSSLRSTAKFLDTRPEVVRWRTIVALGAQWKKEDGVYIPVFTWESGKTFVTVRPLSLRFSGRYSSFLIDVTIAKEKVA